MRPRGRTSGITVNNNWIYNNPDLKHPECHESMTEKELLNALKVDHSTDKHGALKKGKKP